MEAIDLIKKIKQYAGWYAMDDAKDKASFVAWIRNNSSYFPDVNRAIEIVSNNDSWCTDNDDDLNAMFREIGMPTDPDWEPTDESKFFSYEQFLNEGGSSSKISIDATEKLYSDLVKELYFNAKKYCAVDGTPVEIEIGGNAGFRDNVIFVYPGRDKSKYLGASPPFKVMVKGKQQEVFIKKDRSLLNIETLKPAYSTGTNFDTIEELLILIGIAFINMGYNIVFNSEIDEKIKQYKIDHRGSMLSRKIGILDSRVFSFTEFLYEFQLGKGGTKTTFTDDDDVSKVTKKFTGEVNVENLKKEKKLSEKFPEFIAVTYAIDFKKGTLSQERLDAQKFKNDVRKGFAQLSPDLQDEFDESGLDDEFEYFVNNLDAIKNSELKSKIAKLQNFVKSKLIPVTGNNIDYPNINNVGYASDGSLKLIEIFY